ncbi:MAG: Trigger factor [Candidatus Magasanikbacteria bacterium]|nr:Trigger factor [Candidatus Magasanikbacteria bacterium]
MQITQKELPKSRVELTVEIPWSDLEPYLEKAAEHLSEHTNIPGFRPGKAGYDVIKARMGEMKILEEAAETIVRQTFVEALKEKQLTTIGMPKISVKAMAPNNTFIYMAVVALMPKITPPDWRQIAITKKKRSIEDRDVENIINNVRKSQAAEVIVDKAADKTDKIVVDMNISIDNVPVEGGQTKDHGVFLDEAYYIPGLPEQLLGLKKGSIKNFTLKFPAEHYQKNLAGKDAQFQVTVKDVFTRELPELNDDFAKRLGQVTVADLQKLIRQNLEAEAEQKAEQAAEVELLDGLIAKTNFGEIPDVLIDAEKQKMFDELKASLTENGVTFEKYLSDIKKTEAEIAEQFGKGALDRVKGALLLRVLAEKERIEVSAEEMKEEMDRVRETYHDNPQIEERLKDPDVQDYIKRMFVNRKLMKVLKETAVRSKMEAGV